VDEATPDGDTDKGDTNHAAFPSFPLKTFEAKARLCLLVFSQTRRAIGGSLHALDHATLPPETPLSSLSTLSPWVLPLTADIHSKFSLSPSSRGALARSPGLLSCRRFGNCAEIGCLAVHPTYRKGGRGDAMLAYLERLAINSNLTTVFVLSTRYGPDARLLYAAPS
jgi:hypothetical protein